jgi:hypothetical protein
MTLPERLKMYLSVHIMHPKSYSLKGKKGKDIPVTGRGGP